LCQIGTLVSFFSPAFLSITLTHDQIMIHTKNMALMLVAIVAVASAGFLTLVEQDVQATPSTASEQGKIIGHITAVLQDEDGNIKQYIQTDNAVHDDGFNQLIDDVFGTLICPTCLATTTNFNAIGIGTGSVVCCAVNELALPLDVQGGSGCNRFSNAASATVDTGIVTITSSFGGATSGADVASADCIAAVTEAGLFNSVTDTTGQMFAAQTFSAINIATTTDLLTVTWQLTFT